MIAGTHRFPDMDSVIYGQDFAAAVAGEAARLDARRVFVLAGGTLSRTTDLPDRLRAALGPRFAGIWTRMGAHTPRSDVVAAAMAAREAGAERGAQPVGQVGGARQRAAGEHEHAARVQPRGLAGHRGGEVLAIDHAVHVGEAVGAGDHGGAPAVGGGQGEVGGARNSVSAAVSRASPAWSAARRAYSAAAAAKLCRAAGSPAPAKAAISSISATQR